MHEKYHFRQSDARHERSVAVVEAELRLEALATVLAASLLGNPLFPLDLAASHAVRMADQASRWLAAA